MRNDLLGRVELDVGFLSTVLWFFLISGNLVGVSLQELLSSFVAAWLDSSLKSEDNLAVSYLI